MEQLECTTKSEHRKGAHLTYEERVIIQIRHRDGRSLRSIAQEIGCAPNTVHNELRRAEFCSTTGSAWDTELSTVRKYTRATANTADAPRCMKARKHFSPM